MSFFDDDDDDDKDSDSHFADLIPQNDIARISSRLYLAKNMIDGYYIEDSGTISRVYVLLNDHRLLAEEFASSRSRQDAERWLADLVSRLHDQGKSEP